MSKHLSLLVALAILLGTQHSSAQNTSPYWSLAGNSNASSTTSKLGTTNAIPLRLYTNNATRVYINTSGNVGIATTAPAQKLHVAGNTYITGNVGIGTNTLNYKLNVLSSGHAIYGNTTGTTSYGVYGNSPYIGVYGSSGTYGVFGTGTQIGVHGQGGNYGVSATATTSTGYGVIAQGGSRGIYATANTSNGYGVYGVGYYGVYGTGGTYGVYGTSSTFGVYGFGNTGVYGTSNYAGGDALRSYASGTGSCWGLNAYSQYSYGIYASTGTASSYAGYFAGNIYVTGTYGGSDRKLKQNITDMGSAIDVINKLQPKAYEYRQDGNFKLMNLPKGKHYGLIAQDLEQVLPDLVKETEFRTAKAAAPVVGQSNAGSSEPAVVNETNGEIINFKAVNYTELIPILVKAVQEQQQMIEKLQQNNSEQQQQIDDLKTIVRKLSIGQGFDAFLSRAELGEVSPNPVKGNATIQYAIPEGSIRSQLLITDVLGRKIKAFQLTASGVINVDVTSLARGVYNYSLIVDDKIVATKKMTVAK
ncbi:tail fiber domain-containing protein [Chitinophagaceae bacterium LB-8]|uniref:Tail fiber domain-containing protein n=1 Tax=Paraflavisolibacter caeni TaxID=2982496 RepID=A0A9X2XNG8_9BACT|nr:tail fiber domain-containing protein [Paraflavisolibacter caeni]MCU7548174.1 tail fiber domain-containing protein [Paraflavisolibacter caeni]